MTIEKDRDTQVELEFLESVLERQPNDEAVLRALAELYTHLGQYKDGLRLDLKLCQLCPTDPVVWYNLACSYALETRKQDALEALAKAVELGYCDREWMQQDADLTALQDDPEFQQLVASMLPSSS